MRVLVIGSTVLLGEGLVRPLCASGFDLDCFGGVEEGALARRGCGYSAILMAWSLPGSLGFVRSLRQRSDGVPLIAVIPENDVASRVTAFESGADDCVSVRIEGRELVARLRAVLRRPPTVASPVLQAGNLLLDTTSRQLTVGGATLPVPRRELHLLEHLLRRAGRVVPRAAIENDLYGHADGVCPNSVEVRVSRLRRHLAAAGATVGIKTVHGVGYMLSPLAEQRSPVRKRAAAMAAPAQATA